MYDAEGAGLSEAAALYLYIRAIDGEETAAQVPYLFDEPVEFYEAIARAEECPCVGIGEDYEGILSAAEEIGIDPELIEAARKRAKRAHSSRHECESMV